MALTQEDLQQIVDTVSQYQSEPTPDLGDFDKTSFYTTWSNAFHQLGLSGVIALPNTTFDEWLWWFKQWGDKFTDNYNDFKDLVNKTFIELNSDIKIINDDLLKLHETDNEIIQKIQGVNPDQINFLQEVQFEERVDSVTNTPYTIVRIPHLDKKGNVIKIKNGFAHDHFSSVDKETASSFRRRHKQATVIINGAPWNTNNNEIMGKFIQDGVILNSGRSTGKETLGITKDGKLKSYPTTATIDDIVSDGAYNAIGGFFPLIVDGKPYDYTSVYQSTYPNMNTPRPRQVIAQFKNLDIIIFTFDGRTYNYEGLTLEDCVRIITPFGVDFAYNLDGGGSNSTLVNGMMMNPAGDNDKDEREVPNFLYFEKDDHDYLDITDDNEFMTVAKKATSAFRKLFDGLLDEKGNFKPTIPTQLPTTDLQIVANDISKYRGSWFNGGGDLKNVPDTTQNGHYSIIEVIPYNAKSGIIRLIRYGDNAIWVAGVNNGVLTGWDLITNNTKKITFTSLTAIASKLSLYGGNWYTEDGDITGAPTNSEHGHYSLIEIIPRGVNSGLIRLTRYGDNITWQAGVNSGKLTTWATLTGETKKATFTSFSSVASKLDDYVGNWYTEGNDIGNSPSGSENGHYSVVEVIPYQTNSGMIRVTRFGDNLSWQAGVNNGSLTSWKSLV